jgi:succinate dehydrogenase / fumarate reductase cytochrome b subunit
VHDDTVQASLASRTMIWTGLIIFAFIVYHLLHFTLLWTHPEYHALTDSLGRHDVFSMMVLGFQNTFISIFYLVAVGLLTYHLSHGFASMFQTIGWNDKKYDRRFRLIGNLLAVFLFVGYASIPIAVMTGVITLPGGGI